MDGRFQQEIIKAVQEIIPILSPGLILELSNTGAEDLSKFHFGLGLYIRNNILTTDSDIYKIFTENGIIDKDDMSAILIQEVQRRL